MPFSAKPSAAFCLTLVLAAGQLALAVNGYSVPCTEGKCSRDVPADTDTSGFVQSVSLCSTYAKHVADIICLRIHSGALSVRFRTLPLPPVGKLQRNAT